MDACYLLFDRPRKYDRKVQHDSFKNTYSFIKDGVKVILGPSKLGFISKPSKRAEIILITYIEMEKLVNDVNLVYALIAFQENVGINELPPKVQPLLDEFSDVVP